MNRITILCKKAEELASKVVEEGSLEGKSYFTFKDIEDPPAITVTCNNDITYFEICTCRHCSVFHGLYPYVLCSYKCAIIKYLGKKKVEENPQK